MSQTYRHKSDGGKEKTGEDQVAKCSSELYNPEGGGWWNWRDHRNNNNNHHQGTLSCWTAGYVECWNLSLISAALQHSVLHLTASCNNSCLHNMHNYDSNMRVSKSCDRPTMHWCKSAAVFSNDWHRGIMLAWAVNSFVWCSHIKCNMILSVNFISTSRNMSRQTSKITCKYFETYLRYYRSIRMDRKP